MPGHFLRRELRRREPQGAGRRDRLVHLCQQEGRTHAFLEGVLQGSYHHVFHANVLLLHELGVTVANAAAAHMHGGTGLGDGPRNLLQLLLDAVMQIVGGDDGS